MNSIDTWSSLFTASSFFCLKKDEDAGAPLDSLLSRLDDRATDHFHPNRKKEFLFGRLCASKAHELHFGTELLSLPISLNKAPQWPKDVIGSISHNQFWVGAAVSKSESLLGVGIDFEVMGRAKLELGRYIRNAKDLQTHQDLKENELLTLIFSAKESLYKALYPTAKCFFGFEAAAVLDIDTFSGTFKIALISEISPSLGPSGRCQFQGRFKIIGTSCLTVLEIPNLS
jgi:enterobactin synthetase component D